MASDSEITINVKARNQAKKVLQEVSRDVHSMTGNSSRHLQNFADSVATQVKRYSTYLGVAASASAGFAIKSAADYEQARVSFDTMLGSAEAGKKMLSDLSEFAIKTPFNLPDVVEGAKSLKAYGIEADKIIPTFEDLGNIAAGVGRDKLPQLVLAYGQVRTATKLTGQELRQFTEAGVPLLEVLAKQSGKTSAQIKEDMENGIAPTFAEVERAIASMSEEGGQFYNLLERQSKTFSGTVTNLTDQVGRFARKVVGMSEEGEIKEGSIFARLRDGAQQLLEWMNQNEESVTNSITGFVDKFVEGTSRFIGKFVENVKSDGFASAVSQALIEMIGKIDWSGFVAAAVTTFFAIAPDIAIGFAKGLIEAATQNPLDFALLFLALGFMPAGVLAALTTVLAAIPIVGPLLAWITTGFAKVASLALAPLTGAFSALASGVSGAFMAVITNPVTGVVAAAGLALAQVARVVAAVNDLKTLTNEANAQQNAHGAGTTAFYESLKKGVAEGRFSQEEANRRMRDYNANFQSFTGKAIGGPVGQGQPYVVGERGPEVFIPNQSGKIVPNGQSDGMMGGNITIHIASVVNNSAEAVDRFFDWTNREGKLTSMGVTGLRG